MLSNLKEALYQLYGHKEINLQPISGGDINLAFRLSNGKSDHFLKVNTSAQAKGILQSEYDALVYLKNAGIRVPNCNDIHSFSTGYFLIMEYLPQGSPLLPPGRILLKKWLNYIGFLLINMDGKRATL